MRYRRKIITCDYNIINVNSPNSKKVVIFRLNKILSKKLMNKFREHSRDACLRSDTDIMSL